MKTIGILTRDPRETDPTLTIFDKLRKKFNFKMEVINPEEFYCHFPIEKNFIWPKIDVLMPRIATEENLEQFMASVYIVKQFKYFTDIPVLNPIQGTIIAQDKFLSSQIVAAQNILIPRTSLIINKQQIKPVLSKYRYPVVVKQQGGHGGSGVTIFESERSAKSGIESLLINKKPAIIQEFIPSKKIIDYRAIVVGEKVVGGYVRKAPEKDFRANVTQGGKYEFFMPDEKLQRITLKIAEIIEMDILSVDFLKYKNQYYFLEVNQAMGLDYFGNFKKITDEVIKYTLSRTK